MMSSSALDVVIGMLFIFAVFSLLTSGIQELLATGLARRSKNLWDHLYELFDGSTKVSEDPDDDSRKVTEDLIDVFYQSPFVTQLVRPRTTNFSSNAMMRFVRGWGFRSLGRNVLRSDQRKGDRVRGPKSISPAAFSRALLDSITPTGPSDLPELSKQLSPQLFAVLTRLSREAGDDFERFQANVERWFEDQMNHLSSWYRRNTRLWLFLIGLVVAAAFNVDSVRAANVLWHDEVLRSSVLEQATQNPEFVACAEIQDDEKSVTCLEELIETTEGLPVGYPPDVSLELETWPPRLLGWLITASAMMAGATFWFDLLRRVLDISQRINTAGSSIARGA